VVVDFGTATTFDCVNHHGEYVGGAIAPGFGISADALFSRTAKLPKVELDESAPAIGTNTVASMQSGLFWGYVGLVDGLALRCKRELAQRAEGETGTPTRVRCVATGGLSRVIGRQCDEIEDIDDNLTLFGMQQLFALNAGRTRTA
jgi:type III pantothenate kinase